MPVHAVFGNSDNGNYKKSNEGSLQQKADEVLGYMSNVYYVAQQAAGNWTLKKLTVLAQLNSLRTMVFISRLCQTEYHTGFI